MTIYSLIILLSQFWTSVLILIVASWPAYRFLRRRVRWSGTSVSLRIFHSLLWSTQSKALAWSMKQKFFWKCLAFSMIQQMFAIWSLVPLPLLNSAYTSGSSWFTYCWSLTWKILSITFLAYEMSALYGSLNILWHCPSLGLKWKLTFSSPMALLSFPKFADILSAAL